MSQINLLQAKLTGITTEETRFRVRFTVMERGREGRNLADFLLDEAPQLEIGAVYSLTAEKVDESVPE